MWRGGPAEVFRYRCANGAIDVQRWPFDAQAFVPMAVEERMVECSDFVSFRRRPLNSVFLLEGIAKRAVKLLRVIRIIERIQYDQKRLLRFLVLEERIAIAGPHGRDFSGLLVAPKLPQ